MQTNFVELANDAMAVNAKLINKSVDFNVKAAKNAVENATAQAGEMLQSRLWKITLHCKAKWFRTQLSKPTTLPGLMLSWVLKHEMLTLRCGRIILFLRR